MAVYPRVCGGTCGCVRNVSSAPGLSPRVRGNLSVASGFSVPARSIPACAGEPGGLVSHVVDGRSIPACAGEPHASPKSAVGLPVYPRVCGGTL